jgi:thiamine kinase-like enzyme
MKVKLQNTIQGSAKVVQELFPLWKPNELQLSVCTTGLTNKLVKVTHKSGHVVLVRIYGRGTDVLIDREQELKVFYF